MTTWKMFSESKPLFSDLYLVKFKDGRFLGEYGVCYYSQEHKSFGEFISFYDSERDEDYEAFVSCESIVAWAPFQRIDEEHKEKTAEQMFTDLDYKKRIKDGCIEFERHNGNVMAKDWLKHPHEKPVYKLTKFEKELLECYSDVYSFKVFNSLNGMKEKGYFKGIDDNELIGEILAKCEVV